MQAQDVQLTKQRCRAAALGALVADAACQGLYWYLLAAGKLCSFYGCKLRTAAETTRLLTLLFRVPDKELPILLSRPEHKATPEFRDLPEQEHSSPGSLSPVGDELLPLLQSLVCASAPTSLSITKSIICQEMASRFASSAQDHTNQVSSKPLQVHHGGLDGVHYTQTAYDFLRKHEGPKTELGRRFVTSVARGNHFPAGVHYSSVQCLAKVPSLLCRRQPNRRHSRDGCQNDGQ